MILLVCSFAAALIFVWARLSVVMRRVRDLASQLELLADLEGNGQIRLHYDDRLLRGAAEKPNSILALLRREKVRIENADAALQRAMPGWSHDLRTPPTAVREYIALLQKQPQTEDDVRYLDVVARRLKTLEATLDDLFSFSLALSSAGTMPVEPVNLGAKTELATAAFYDAWVDRGLSIDVATPDRRSGCGLLSMRSGAYCTTCSPTPRNTRVASFVRVWADASGSVVVENDAEHFDPTLLHELLDLGSALTVVSPDGQGRRARNGAPAVREDGCAVYDRSAGRRTARRHIFPGRQRHRSRVISRLRNPGPGETDVSSKRGHKKRKDVPCTASDPSVLLPHS